MDWRQQNDIPTSLPIHAIVQETPLVRTFVFRHRLGAQPGQFVNVWLPRVDEKPISLAFDGGDFFELAIAQVGSFTKELFKKKVGDLVGIRGPYGTHFTFQPGQHLALVAGGYGAAPLYFLAKQAIAKKCRITFLPGARSKDHLLYVDRFKKLPNTTIHPATDDGSFGHKGYNTEVLETFLAKERPDSILTCGPELMMKKVSDLAWQRKIPAQIDLERYMKCGFGVCGNCCVDDVGISTCMKGTIISNETARAIAEFGVYHRDDIGKKHFFSSFL